MPTAEFFTRFGLFVRKNFLDRELCTRCCSEMNAAAQAQATIAGPNETDVLDENIRKVKWADVPATSVSLVEARLLALIPTLERHFPLLRQNAETMQPGEYRAIAAP